MNHSPSPLPFQILHCLILEKTRVESFMLHFVDSWDLPPISIVETRYSSLWLPLSQYFKNVPLSQKTGQPLKKILSIPRMTI
jgi:hypothetical protein